MKIQRETLKELGKSFFNLANMLIVLSIINAVFNNKVDIPLEFVIIFIIWVVFFLYGSGILLLNKGNEND